MVQILSVCIWVRVRLEGLRSGRIRVQKFSDPYSIYIHIRIMKVGYIWCRCPSKSYPTPTTNIRILSEFEGKYENKYGIGNIHLYPIRLHPYAKPFIPHPFKLPFRLGTKELDVVIFAHRVSRSIQDWIWGQHQKKEIQYQFHCHMPTRTSSW